jgi:ethanolamine utilization protein EutN
MQLGAVVGHAVSTVKHASLVGWRLLLIQLQTPDGRADGEPLLALDRLGAAVGDRVIVSNDGIGARELVGSRQTPARWTVLGLCDR